MLICGCVWRIIHVDEILTDYLFNHATVSQMLSSKYSLWYISLLRINAISLINSKVKIEWQIICEGQELEAFILDVLWEPAS